MSMQYVTLWAHPIVGCDSIREFGISSKFLSIDGQKPVGQARAIAGFLLHPTTFHGLQPGFHSSVRLSRIRTFTPRLWLVFGKNPRMDEYEKHAHDEGDRLLADDSRPWSRSSSREEQPWATSEPETFQPSPTVLNDDAILAFAQQTRAEWRARESRTNDRTEGRWSGRPAAREDEQTREWRQRAEEAERKLREGMDPEVWPTQQELDDAKQRIAYDQSLFYFGVAGVSGSGKSSLVNAFRGVINDNENKKAARTGTTETTKKVQAYRDPYPRSPFVWCDIPGAGTLKVPGSSYFIQQGLFVFDCMVVVWDSRFTEVDIEILRNCERFKIPAYIVRSKSDQHITNLAADMKDRRDADRGEDSDSEDSFEDMALFREQARAKYIAESRASVAANLKEAGLQEKRVYLVSKNAVYKIVEARNTTEEKGGRRSLLPRSKSKALKSKKPKSKMDVDESKLMQDLLKETEIRQPKTLGPYIPATTISMSSMANFVGSAVSALT